MDYCLRELQLTELEILKKFKDLCEKHSLTYYLSSGTALGAVRHQGFIPWDDDIDVCMPYEDYKVFSKIAQEELGDRFFVQNCMTDPNFYSPYTKIRLNGTTCLEKYYKSYDVHHGVWIDIFPLIEVNPGFDYKMRNFLIKASAMLQIENHMNGHIEDFKKTIGSFGVYAVKTISRIPMHLRQKMHQWILAYVFSGKHKTHRIEVYARLFQMPQEVSTFEGTSNVVFEGIVFSGPANCDAYLTALFGDYMKLPPVAKQVNHMGEDGIVDLKNGYQYYMDFN